MKLYDKDEKMMIKYKNIPIISALFQCHYPPWEFHNRTSLIPRNVTNHILVFPIWDIRMSLQRPERRRTTPINNTSDDDQGGIGHVDLHVAVRRGDLSGVRDMVARDIDVVSRKDSEGNLPLHLAVVNGEKEIVEYLVEKYPKGSYVLNQEKKCPIYLAVESGCVEFVNCMLAACVNDANCVKVLNKLQRPIVHLAITHQNLEMVKTILERRPELIKSKDDQGWTPLSYAAFQGHLNIVKHLLKAFPKSISYRNDQDGSLPVHKACLGDKLEVLTFFHSAFSKSLFGEDADGRNILHIAAKERDNRLKNVVSYLVNLAINNSTCKKSLNIADGCGYKPLALAKRSGNDEIATLLSDAGMY